MKVLNIEVVKPQQSMIITTERNTYLIKLEPHAGRGVHVIPRVYIRKNIFFKIKIWKEKYYFPINCFTTKQVKEMTLKNAINLFTEYIKSIEEKLEKEESALKTWY